VTGPLDRLLARVGRPEKRRLRGAVACAALLGLATVALLGVSGWFIAAAAGAGAAGAVAGAFNYMLPSAAIRLGAIARTGARYGERLLGHQVALMTMARVRPLLFAALARMAPARALSVTAGQAAAVLVQDVQAIEMRLAQRTAAWGAAAATMAGVSLAAVAGWAPALSTALVALALGLSGLALATHSRTTAIALRQATGQLKDHLAFLAAAQVELRCHALEGWAADTIAEASTALDAAQRRHAAVLGCFDVLQALATGLAATVGIWLALAAGAPLAALAGLSAAMAIEGMAPWLRALAHRGGASEAAHRLDDLLEAPEATAADEAASSPALPTITLSAFGGVCLREGERVAIVGPSGCGKTTLVETLVGLRACATGVVSIGGRDVAAGSVAAQRACFAWLPQDCALITGTVRDNLRLARDGVDELTMWRVLRDAALADRVRTLPQGLDTWLGADGARLSGGERRRLALARAYLSDAPWLLLDEPTVGLDPVTEVAVLDALEARLADTGQGLIVVTHRASLVARCDRTLSFAVSQAQAESLASLAA
jgi:ATP-binding cassette subfamily C protein CydC